MSLSTCRIIVSVCAALVLSGCGNDVVEDVEVPVRPVKIFKVSGDSSTAVRSFPGVIDASQRAELAFRVPGTVEKIYVKEGDQVKRGQLLAELDDADYAITVQDKKATAEKDERNFKRGQELIVDGNISRMDFDRMEASMKTSAAALALAEQNLAYTQLKAPFDGRVAVRSIENFEEVAAKQEVMRLQDENELEVKVSLPESLVRSIRKTGEVAARDAVTSYAVFEGNGGTQFPLAIKELSSKADPQTQTFSVTLSMASPSEFPVLPGMTTTVSMDFSKIINVDIVHWIPARAVVAESDLNAQIWILDPASMTVKSRKVTIGRMSGSKIEIKQGLIGGEEIISVGASYLAEDMKVTRMIQSEQAVPRADDPV
ncbi:efflux RND transporter periplasmic adaptor subunit [Oceanicoccus sagamiensis]|uniref:Efflux transporter periplasmic adaptor subunit n=1 Tax=Oceanicoccus sagamiensis TaxID=716816 RepID=A0A1X9NB16_9GAMM|nr:efflux RND transporter periplasmic adaptor subunit [Oceanicoccus sagamiensis]ARN74244.1 efflux transporter periplasmic adaptor subunit [Oceanicoccus sagamiensis]